MTIIVETGAVIANANALCSEDFADEYHEARGNTAWNDISDKEATLIRGTDYMQQMFRARWKGYRKSALQTLDWPRELVFLEAAVSGIGVDPGYAADRSYGVWIGNDVVPLEVKQACAEYGLRAGTQTLLPDLGRTVRSKAVGPISITYEPGSPESKRYLAIDLLLAPFLAQQSFTARVVRA